MTTLTLPERVPISEAETHGQLGADHVDSTLNISGGIVQESLLAPTLESGTGWNSQEEQGTASVRPVHLAKPLIRLPEGTLPKKRMLVLQQWEGVVTEVAADSFFAELQDLGDSSQPIEIVEIPIDEVPKDDQSLLASGSIFYWSIGHETSAGGQLRRISEIRMRRTPRWTQQTIRRVIERAEELFETHGQH
jgi:hypothetical protein